MSRDQEVKEQRRICKKGKEMVTKSRPVRSESSSVRKGKLRLMHPCARRALCQLCCVTNNSQVPWLSQSP